MEKPPEIDAGIVLYLSTVQDPMLIDHDQVDSDLTFVDGRAILSVGEAIRLVNNDETSDPNLTLEIDRQREILKLQRPASPLDGTFLSEAAEATMAAEADQVIIIEPELLPLLADSYWRVAIWEAFYMRDCVGVPNEQDVASDAYDISEDLEESKRMLSTSMHLRQRIIDYIQLRKS